MINSQGHAWITICVSINVFLLSSLEQSESHACPMEDLLGVAVKQMMRFDRTRAVKKLSQEKGCVFVHLCPHCGCSGIKNTSSVSSPACQMWRFGVHVPFETSCHRSTQEGLSLCSACHLATPGAAWHVWIRSDVHKKVNTNGSGWPGCLFWREWARYFRLCHLYSGLTPLGLFMLGT